MANKHYAPSMTFTESEVRLPKREAFGTTRTGMILTANSGYGNIPINIKSENQLVDTFGYPTEYNYKAWFDAAGYLKYANELYVIRPVNTAWTNAGVGVEYDPSEDDVTINARTKANMYNPDKAEALLDTETVTGGDKIEFFAKTISNKDDIAVTVCSKEGDYASPIFTETAVYINSNIVTATVSASVPTLVQAENYGPVTCSAYGGSIGHGFSIISAASGTIWYLNKNAATAVWVNTTIAVTADTLFYLEDGVNNCIGNLDAVTAGTKTFTAKTVQPVNNAVTKIKVIASNTVQYVVPQYLGSSLYNSSTKLPVNYQDIIKPTPDFINYECGVAIFKKDTQGYWQLAETFVGSFDITAKTTAGLSKYIANVINKNSKYVYCIAEALDRGVNDDEYDFSTTLSSITDMTIDDVSNVDYSAPWTGSTAWNGRDMSSYATGALGTTAIEEAAEIFGLNGLMNPELLIGFNNGRSSGYLDSMPVIANDTGFSVAIVSLYNHEEYIGENEETINQSVIDSLGNQRDDTSIGALTEFNSYTMSFGQMKYFYDKYNDKYRWVPVAGDMAGLLTRNDLMYGPQSALAGYNRGGYDNFSKLLSTGTYDQDELSKNGINQIIFDYDTQAYILFEFLTNTQLDLIVKEANVRRMNIFIKQFLKRVLKGNYFEFNNESTRSTTLYKITAFFEALKKSGGLYDYLLICDETNNTAERINSNEFVLDVRLQPNRVIKHIIVNIINYDMGINISEIE